MMRKEIKICLPFYKIVYSVFFIFVLSLVRGVNFTFEIGIALEPPLAILAAVFCADTYVQEIMSKRSEVEKLCPMKNRIISIFRRVGVQEVYLLLLAAAGYGMFYIIQRPVVFYGLQSETGDEVHQFFVYIAAVTAALLFWGLLSLVLSCLFRNIWAGIGGCLVLWIVTDSQLGENILGKWNLFSYSFRNAEDSQDMGWICGKMICAAFCIIMIVLLPKIIEKRG